MQYQEVSQVTPSNCNRVCWGAGTLTGPASSGVAVTLGNTETITGVKTMSGLNVITHSKYRSYRKKPSQYFLIHNNRSKESQTLEH